VTTFESRDKTDTSNRDAILTFVWTVFEQLDHSSSDSERQGDLHCLDSSASVLQHSCYTLGMNEKPSRNPKSTRKFFLDGSVETVSSAKPRAASQRVDPMERFQRAELAKWGALLALGCGILFFKALFWARWVPLLPEDLNTNERYFGRTEANQFVLDYSKLPAFVGKLTAGQVPLEKIAYDLTPIGAILAAFFASALLRFFAAKHLSKTGYRASDAIRDWLITGVITGVVSVLGILIVRWIVPALPYDASRTASYLISRYAILALSAILGGWIAARLAVRKEGLLGRLSLVQLLGQGLLVAAFALPINALIDKLVKVLPGLIWMTGIPALLGLCAAAFVLASAWKADQTLRRLQAGTSGSALRFVARGGEPIEMNLTVLGSRESGKTVLLAGAYHEWIEELAENHGVYLTPIQTMPVNYEQLAPDAQRYYLDRNLDYLSQQIYVLNQWPPSTQTMREFKFEVSVQLEKDKPPVKVARINLLDYPGSLLVTNEISADAHKKFWQRIADSDGLLFVGDISAMRRGVEEKGMADVFEAFRAAMDVLIDGRTLRKMGASVASRIEGNGKNRVIPVGLVLTKCDECVNPETGMPDHLLMDQLIYGESHTRSKNDKAAASVLYSGHYGLLQEWERKCKLDGPGFAETEVFKTTAITASRPALGPDNQSDLSQPYLMISPSQTRPTNCATPLLWLIAKSLRWNVTLFTELTRWLTGSADTEAQQQLAAIRRLEEVVAQWQDMARRG
jgi:hypothetical protein